MLIVSFDTEITRFRIADLLVQCATLGLDLWRFMSSAFMSVIGMVSRELEWTKICGWNITGVVCQISVHRSCFRNVSVAN